MTQNDTNRQKRGSIGTDGGEKPSVGNWGRILESKNSPSDQRIRSKSAIAQKPPVAERLWIGQPNRVLPWKKTEY